ncbi:MAG TPA: GTPase ObgE [Epulopiscium sp.]|nr:GTPase ObgE [Candidatus Epulonipiscium sp.]
MFIDRVQILISSGKGGDGCVSFRREKYVPSGGPDGGDGGKGGSIIFEVDPGTNTLMKFRHNKHFKAMPGANGSKTQCTGKDAPNLIIKVPQGTVIREVKSGQVMADLFGIDTKRVLLKGGKGGKGNQHFATPTRQAPKYAQSGQEGKEYTVTLELKMIADVGLVGYPNVGKSTLLSMVSNAQPKIANYHFTTLSPNLGVVTTKYGKEFVMADIPGLIEGAADGVGLGHSFLRHIERTKVLLHVVDASGSEGRDPVEDIYAIKKELDLYNPEMLKDKPQIIAANKMDIEGSEENFQKIKAEFEPKGIRVFPISAAGNQNLQELLEEVTKVLIDLPNEPVMFEEDFVEVKEEEITPFVVTKIDEDYYLVEGKGVEKVIGYTSLDAEKGFAFFQSYLREKGIIDALKEAGIQEGNTVRIYNLEFEYYE